MHFMETVTAEETKTEPFLISVGRVISGEANVGDLVTFLPSGFAAKIATIETFLNVQQTKIIAGQSVALVLEPSVSVKRGELVIRSGEEAPVIKKRFRTTLFWFAEEPLRAGKTFSMRSGTSEQTVKVERVFSSVTSSAQTKDQVKEENRVVSCELTCEAGVLVESTAGCEANNRFVAVDGFETVGVGRKAFAVKKEKSANVPQKRVK